MHSCSLLHRSIDRHSISRFVVLSLTQFNWANITATVVNQLKASSNGLNALLKILRRIVVTSGLWVSKSRKDLGLGLYYLGHYESVVSCIVHFWNDLLELHHRHLHIYTHSYFYPEYPKLIFIALKNDFNQLSRIIVIKLSACAYTVKNRVLNYTPLIIYVGVHMYPGCCCNT